MPEADFKQQFSALLKKQKMSWDDVTASEPYQTNPELRSVMRSAFYDHARSTEKWGGMTDDQRKEFRMMVYGKDVPTLGDQIKSAFSLISPTAGQLLFPEHAADVRNSIGSGLLAGAAHMAGEVGKLDPYQIGAMGQGVTAAARIGQGMEHWLDDKAQEFAPEQETVATKVAGMTGQGVGEFPAIALWGSIPYVGFALKGAYDAHDPYSAEAPKEQLKNIGKGALFGALMDRVFKFAHGKDLGKQALTLGIGGTTLGIGEQIDYTALDEYTTALAMKDKDRAKKSFDKAFKNVDLEDAGASGIAMVIMGAAMGGKKEGVPEELRGFIPDEPIKVDGKSFEKVKASVKEKAPAEELQQLGERFITESAKNPEVVQEIQSVISSQEELKAWQAKKAQRDQDNPYSGVNESVRNESVESIRSRTKGDPDARDIAFAERNFAAKRRASVMEPGDTIKLGDEILTVESVMPRGDTVAIVVKNKSGEVQVLDHTALLPADVTLKDGTKISEPTKITTRETNNALEELRVADQQETSAPLISESVRDAIVNNRKIDSTRVREVGKKLYLTGRKEGSIDAEAPVRGMSPTEMRKALRDGKFEGSSDYAGTMYGAIYADGVSPIYGDSTKIPVWAIFPREANEGSMGKRGGYEEVSLNPNTPVDSVRWIVGDSQKVLTTAELRDALTEPTGQPKAGFTVAEKEYVPTAPESGKVREAPKQERTGTNAIEATVEKELGKPIRYGEAKGNDVGYESEGAIVLQKRGDMNALAHEALHGLTRKHGKDPNKLPDSIMRKGSKLSKSEEFAEFTRMLLMAPSEAKKQWPAFYKLFVPELSRSKDPFMKSFKRVKDAFDRYYAQDSTERVIASIQFEPEAKSAWDTFKHFPTRIAQYADRYAGISKALAILVEGDKPRWFKSKKRLEIEEELQSYQALEPTGGRVLGLQENRFDPHAEVYVNFDGTTVPIKGPTFGKVLHKVYKPVSAPSRWVKGKRGAKHGLEVTEYGEKLSAARIAITALEEGAKFSDVEFMTRFKHTRKDFESVLEQFKNEGILDEIKGDIKVIRDAYKWSLDALEQAGVLKPGQADEIFNAGSEYHAVLGRVKDKRTGPADPTKGRKGSMRDFQDPNILDIELINANLRLAAKNQHQGLVANLLMRFEGHERFAREVDPTTLEVTDLKARDIYSILKRFGDKNANLDQIAADLKESPQSIFRHKDKQGNEYILWKENGKRRAMLVEDDMLLHALNALDPETAGILTKAINSQKGTKQLASLLAAPKQIRQAVATSEPFFKFIRNPFRDAFVVLGYSKHIHPANVLPKIISAWRDIAKNTPEYAEARANGLAQFNWATEGGRDVVKGAVKKAGRSKPKKGYKWAGNLLEFAPRYAEYKAALKHHLANGVPRQEAIMRAVAAGNDVSINFSAGGTGSRLVNRFSLFHNANAQDVRKIMRIARDPKAFAKFVTVGVISQTIPTLILDKVYEDNETYQNIPDWVFAFSHPIVVGDKVIPIPKPFLYGALFSDLLGRGVIEGKLFDYKERKAIGKAVGNQVPTPANFLPDALTLYLQKARNKVDFFDVPIEPGYMQDREPRYRKRPNTPGLAALVSDVANDLGVETSPEMVNYAFRSMFMKYYMASARLLDQMGLDGDRDQPATGTGSSQNELARHLEFTDEFTRTMVAPAVLRGGRNTSFAWDAAHAVESLREASRDQDRVEEYKAELKKNKWAQDKDIRTDVEKATDKYRGEYGAVVAAMTYLSDSTSTHDAQRERLFPGTARLQHEKRGAATLLKIIKESKNLSDAEKKEVRNAFQRVAFNTKTSRARVKNGLPILEIKQIDSVDLRRRVLNELKLHRDRMTNQYVKEMEKYGVLPR